MLIKAQTASHKSTHYTTSHCTAKHSTTLHMSVRINNNATTTHRHHSSDSVAQHGRKSVAPTSTDTLIADPRDTVDTASRLA